VYHLRELFGCRLFTRDLNLQLQHLEMGISFITMLVSSMRPPLLYGCRWRYVHYLNEIFGCRMYTHNLNQLASTKETVSYYEIRYRRHNRELINKTSNPDSSFIVRMLYKDVLGTTSLLSLSCLYCFVLFSPLSYMYYFAFYQSLLTEYMI